MRRTIRPPRLLALSHARRLHARLPRWSRPLGLGANRPTIPEDISVIGFDGLELGEFYTPKLTTIRQQASLLVDRGVALLLGTLERGAVARHETVPFTLAVRESTSHPPRKDGTNS